MDLRSKMLDLDPKIWQKHQIYNLVITFSKALHLTHLAKITDHSCHRASCVHATLVRSKVTTLQGDGIKSHLLSLLDKTILLAH